MDKIVDKINQELAAAPGITVPTITLEGDANGAPHADASSYAKKFSGKYEQHVIEGGVGHDLPQEARRPLPRLSPTSREDDRHHALQIAIG